MTMTSTSPSPKPGQPQMPECWLPTASAFCSPPEQAEQMAAALWQAAQQSRSVPWPGRPKEKKNAACPFANAYPHIAEFIAGEGWIELGQDEYSPSLLRALDAGGLIWESSEGHKTLDQALLALEEKLAAGPYR